MQSLTDRTFVGNHISVCICTYKRPGLLANLLENLKQQVTDNLLSYSIVVVDNDVNESAKTIVETFKQKSSVNIDYFIEPEQNISLARNRAVGNATGNFIALIDDDEYPEANWLLSFYKTLMNFNADGALGPVLPYYPDGTPKWIIRSRLCELPMYKTGDVLHWGETKTGNVLLKRGILEREVKPFDPQFGRTGGEDQDFFRRMMSKGRRFVWCNEAIVNETVSPERWRKNFYVKKYLQQGGRTGELAKKWPFSLKCKGFVKATVALSSYTLAIPFSCLGGQHVFMKCLLKNVYYISWFVGFLWRPIIRFRY
jgi:glycosyltransferase involved in cell wall biosynthesis